MLRMYAFSGDFAGSLFYGEGGVAVVDGHVSTNIYYLNFYLNFYQNFLPELWLTNFFIIYNIVSILRNLVHPLLDK